MRGAIAEAQLFLKISVDAQANQLYPDRAQVFVSPLMGRGGAAFMRRFFKIGAILLATHGALAGIARSEEAPAVLATVNGVAITEDDVARILKITAKYNPDFAINARSKKEVLERLIDTLLMEAKLKKDGDLAGPDAVAELDLARKNAVRAYFVSEKMEKPKPPTLEEVDRFAKEHPSLFAERKAWHYADLKFGKDEKVDIHVIKAMAMVSNQKKNVADPNAPRWAKLDRALGYLTSISEPYTLFRGFRDSEQIDGKILKILEGAHPDEIIVDDESDSEYYHVVLLVSVEPDSVEVNTARNAIFRGMVLERDAAGLKKAVAELRTGAQIKYGATPTKAQGR
jgi:EpsD family peptidyl-prolyl cis-trans isomerase